ncbi:MAG: UDP-N-acetylmuramate dehydrogenase [Chloroflexi bacterium]|nr:UDP-N-acetylmuramate dehydrogenase [Chloroflexota bacterium]
MTPTRSNPAPPLTSEVRAELRATFGQDVRFDVPLAAWTAARLGGPADAVLTVTSRAQLTRAVQWLQERRVPYRILGGGSNVLIADEGIEGVVVLNRARGTRFFEHEGKPAVWAESGASFGGLARRAIAQGLDGLTWAAGIPGTVGGAVVGNAGAYGGDVASSLLWADVLLHDGRVERLTAAELAMDYRTSALKTGALPGVVIGAAFRLRAGDPDVLRAQLAALHERRRRSQPQGASLGSIFKNPPGDYAGRLIDAAGLKGTRIGGVMVSPQHANFFIHLGGGTARDYARLMCLVRRTVWERFHIWLEPEIQLLGRWPHHLRACAGVLA